MSEDELALEIVKGRVRDRDAEIAKLRAELTAAEEVGARQRDRAKDAERSLAAAQTELAELRAKVERLRVELMQVVARRDKRDEVIAAAMRDSHRAIETIADLRVGLAETAVERDNAGRLLKEEQQTARQLRDVAAKCHARAARAEAEVDRLRAGVQCHAAHPGEGTYECRIDKPCPACRLRDLVADLAEARAVVRLAYEGLAYEYEMCPQFHDMTVEEWDEWLVRAAAVLAKVKP